MMLLATFAIAVLLGSNAHASTAPPTSHFTGTGRDCHGTLAIATKTISWNTSFSHCKPKPFRLAEETSIDGRRRLTFAFNNNAPACRFQVISLTHDENSSEDTGWEATGYADMASYQADKRSAYTRNAPDMMSCALVRDPQQTR